MIVEVIDVETKIKRANGDARPDRLHPVLTNRQVEIARLIGEGFVAKQVAAKLNISEKTVETHRANIMRLVDVHNVAQLVCWLFRQKLLLVEELPDRVSPANENGAGRTGS